MKSNSVRKPAVPMILILLSAAMGFCLDLSTDSTAIALNRGDLKSASHLIQSAEAGSKIAALFYQESMLAKTNPTLKLRLGKVELAFENRLRKEMNPLTFGAYRRLAADGNLNEPDRMRLIIPMIEGSPKLSLIQKDSLKAFLKGLLASGISANMKAGLLIQSTRMSSVGLDAKSLLPFCRSTDTTIRKAAYHGLICVITQNRDLGNTALNHAVFDSIKGDGSRTPDLYQVLALISIGEDYARDYLLSKCGSDVVKLVAIIRHDPYLKHPGLVIAALSFSKDTPQGVSARAALRYGLKDPAWVADQIASPPLSDTSKANELRRVMTTQSTASR